MTRLPQRFAFRMRLATQRWRASAVRIVADDGSEVHWDRCDDFEAARALARHRLRPGTMGFVWQPCAGRRTVIVEHAAQLPVARMLARRAGWPPLLTRFELSAAPADRADRPMCARRPA